MDFTEAQLEAINAPRDNIVVCAAAGSGKTTVLCNRIAKRVAEGECDVSEILVVTFTIASADDLKIKLKNTLTASLASAKTEASRSYLRDQLRLLPSARISTIHSFALEMIRENFDKLGLPARIRVADEWESGVIAARAMDLVIEECYKNDEDGSFADFTDLLVSDRDGELGEFFLGIYRKLVNEPEGIELIKGNIELLRQNREVDFFETPWGAVIKQNAEKKLDYCLKYLTEARDQYTEDSPAYKFYGTRFISICNCVKELRDSLELGALEVRRCLSSMELPSFQGNPGAKAKEAQIHHYRYYKEIYDYFKDLVANNGKKLGFLFDYERISEDIEQTAVCLESLYKLLSEFDKTFGEEKKKRGLVDFTDIERMTHSLLLEKDGSITELARKYREEFSEIYVDEYQDTNKIQDDIFRAISRSEGNLFIVGDIKQSIYGFRGACPEIFSKYRKHGFPQKKGRTVFLSENFRSDENIVYFSNSVFSKIMKQVETVGYTCEDDLKHSKSGEDCKAPVEIYLFGDKKGEENCSQGEFVASYIRKELDRGVAPGSIAILCRSLTGSGLDELVEGCKKYKIPLSLGNDAQFFKKPWVLMLLCLLKTIDNKNSDIYLTGALKGEIFGFTFDMLSKIRCECGSEPGMWYSLKKYINDRESMGVEDEITVRGRRFFSFISEMSRLEGNLSVDELVRSVIYGSGIIHAMSVGKDGEVAEEIRSDILKVYSYAVNFAANGTMGLSSFLSYLGGLMEGDRGKKTKKETPGTVRLMTIHGSKGLQFPVCILYNTEKNFKLNLADKDCPVIYGGELGFGLRLKGDVIESKHDTGVTAAIRQRYADDQREEEMRLLYVAFTRAENKLIITGRSSIDLSAPSPFEVEHTRVMSASNYLDWIYLCLGNADKECYTFSFNPPAASLPCEVDGGRKEWDELSLTPEEQARLETVYLEYKNANLGLPAKASVSSLSPDFLDRDGEDDEGDEKTREKKELLPKFMSGEMDELGAQKGTATHLFMQFCDFGNCVSRDGGIAEMVDAEIGRLLEMEFIDGHTASLINRKGICRFFESRLYKMISSSKEVLRERRFNVKLDAACFTENDQRRKALDGSELLVQGVIDCMFFDTEGRLVLVDYKTDGFSPSATRKTVESTLRERYKNQLSYYLLALDKIYPEVEKRAVIYSFFLGDHFEL